MHDQNAIGHAQHLGKFRADHQDHLSFVGKCVHQLIDFILGPHVNPARGFIKNQNLAVPGQPLGHDQLLLIAATEMSCRLLWAREFHAHGLDIGFKRGLLCLPTQHAFAHVLIQVGQPEVVSAGMLQHEPLKLAVFGEQADARGDGLSRRFQAEGLPIQFNGPGIPLVRTEKQSGQFRSAGTHQASQGQDFSPSGFQGNSLDGRASREARGLETYCPGLGFALGEFLIQGATDHAFDQAFPSALIDGKRPGMGAIAQHHHPIGDLKDFIQAMTDVNHPQTPLAALVNDGKETLDLAGGQYGRRFVQHQDPCFQAQGPGNLHRLLLRNGQTLAGSVRIKVHPQFLQQFGGTLALSHVLDDAMLEDLLAQEDVLGR